MSDYTVALSAPVTNGTVAALFISDGLWSKGFILLG